VVGAGGISVAAGGRSRIGARGRAEASDLEVRLPWTAWPRPREVARGPAQEEEAVVVTDKIFGA
jgi:hypothetical protein